MAPWNLYPRSYHIAILHRLHLPSALSSALSIASSTASPTVPSSASCAPHRVSRALCVLSPLAIPGADGRVTKHTQRTLTEAEKISNPNPNSITPRPTMMLFGTYAAPAAADTLPGLRPLDLMVPILETIRDHVVPWFSVEWFRAIAVRLLTLVRFCLENGIRPQPGAWLDELKPNLNLVAGLPLPSAGSTG
ncbi:hypothetical protein EDB80DRAFT_817790 [Ilyonectria destructans]|nr:hypothetical protein EDB80DRAFT_817790 [Ilyonectria destructans]